MLYMSVSMVFGIKLSFNRDKQFTLFFPSLIELKVQTKWCNGGTGWFLLGIIQYAKQQMWELTKWQAKSTICWRTSEFWRTRGRLYSYVDPRTHDIIGSQDLKWQWSEQQHGHPSQASSADRPVRMTGSRCFMCGHKSIKRLTFHGIWLFLSRQPPAAGLCFSGPVVLLHKGVSQDTLSAPPLIIKRFKLMMWENSSRLLSCLCAGLFSGVFHYPKPVRLAGLYYRRAGNEPDLSRPPMSPKEDLKKEQLFSQWLGSTCRIYHSSKHTRTFRNWPRSRVCSCCKSCSLSANIPLIGWVTV